MRFISRIRRTIFLQAPKTFCGVVVLGAAIALAPAHSDVQTSKQDSIWQPMKVFIGNWRGSGHSESGPGEYSRTYQFALGKRFIEVKNTSTYAPTGKHPEGEVHEDVGYLSYDKNRRTFMLRQFHIEGFVNQYAMDSISHDGNKIVFTSEAIENIPAGWRARETYDILREDEIRETFELAEPGKPFSVYSTVTLRRVK